MIVDTHCHLHFDAFDADRDAVVARAKEHGVSHLVNVGTDPVTNEASYLLSKKYEGVSFTAGLHPHHSHEVDEAGLEGIETFIVEKKPSAVGEIGLDYMKSQAEVPDQKKTFVHMLRLALKHDLPVIVHSRNAFRDTLDILKSEGKGKLRGVMHCFSYDTPSLKELLDIGFLASFTCNLTFKNAGPLVDVASRAPLDRIMLETDSPYLAPQIYRGKRNEPACLSHLADFLSEKRGIPRETLEETTTRTALSFFKISGA